MVVKPKQKVCFRALRCYPWKRQVTEAGSSDNLKSHHSTICLLKIAPQVQNILQLLPCRGMNIQLSNTDPPGRETEQSFHVGCLLQRRGRAEGTHGCSLTGKGLSPAAQRPKHPALLLPGSLSASVPIQLSPQASPCVPLLILIPNFATSMDVQVSQRASL